MKILVLGSGVVGTASAYYLARAGHEVTVLDRQDAPGMETSFANAGQVTPGCTAPWAAPGLPQKALRWLLMRHRPFVLWPRLDPRLAWWMSSILANCTAQAYRTNKARMLRLANYSRDALRTLREETGIDYAQRRLGTLVLYRTEAQAAHAIEERPLLAELGVPHELVDAAGCIRIEPALARARIKPAGGMHLPDDESGDAHLFTRALAERAASLGVTFRHGVRITGLDTDGDTIARVMTDAGPFTAERYVVALGSYAPSLLRRIGLRLPVYPVKGYSITVPITNEDAAPRAALADETYKVAITRLGDTIRAAGSAELAGFDTRLRPPRRAAIEKSLSDLFPEAGDATQGPFWAGLRPMTPDGTPVVGPTRYRNLYLNTGHGTLGWTMACGSALVLTDLLSGRTPEIAADDLALSRYDASRAMPA